MCHKRNQFGTTRTMMLSGNKEREKATLIVMYVYIKKLNKQGGLEQYITQASSKNWCRKNPDRFRVFSQASFKVSCLNYLVWHVLVK